MRKSAVGLRGPVSDSGVGLWRPVVSLLLWSAGIWLARIARQLRAPGAVRRDSSQSALEFYAEAGAPEGALFLDGQYIGKIPGVTRL